MPGTYTPSPNGGAQSPSPQPGPGVAPALSIPLGTEAPTIESITQQMKTKADFIAYIQKAAALSPAWPLNTALAQVGFTPVTQSGSGTGTIVPTGTGYGGLNFVIKIIASGAVGTGTFQYSTDGGNTYSSTTTTTSAYTIGATGVTANFAGSFVAGDTYSWQQAFTPQARFLDAAGNGRFLIDHNGTEMSRIVKSDEVWPVYLGTGNTSGTISGYSQYQFARTGTSLTYGTSINDVHCFAFSSASLVSGDNALIFRAAPIYAPRTSSPGHAMVAVLDMLVSPQGLAPGASFFAGLCDSSGLPPSAHLNAYFNLPGTLGAKWQCVTGASGANVTTTTTSGSTQPLWTRLRIEFHNAASPLGTALGAAALVFWINDSMVLATTTGVPQSNTYSMCFTTGVSVQSSGSAYLALVGPWSYRVIQGDFSSVV